MAKRILSRINGAYVIATIALFAALGGGYAVAFSGSGSLQKGALKNIPASLTTVRSLTGVGSIGAYCNPSTDNVYFVLTNNSGETLAIRGEGQGHTVASGSSSQENISTDSTGQFVGHISPVDGTKAPQVSLQVSVLDTNDCWTSVIDVLALNTQQ
jgi:hypothetical protein